MAGHPPPSCRRLWPGASGSSASASGFDALEPDNIDGYQNNTGFPITAARAAEPTTSGWPRQAHRSGWPSSRRTTRTRRWSWCPTSTASSTEQCNQYHECSAFRPTWRPASRSWTPSTAFRGQLLRPRTAALGDHGRPVQPGAGRAGLPALLVGAIAAAAPRPPLLRVHPPLPCESGFTTVEGRRRSSRKPTPGELKWPPLRPTHPRRPKPARPPRIPPGRSSTRRRRWSRSTCLRSTWPSGRRWSGRAVTGASTGFARRARWPAAGEP